MRSGVDSLKREGPERCDLNGSSAITCRPWRCISRNDIRFVGGNPLRAVFAVDRLVRTLIVNDKDTWFGEVTRLVQALAWAASWGLLIALQISKSDVYSSSRTYDAKVPISCAFDMIDMLEIGQAHRPLSSCHKELECAVTEGETSPHIIYGTRRFHARCCNSTHSASILCCRCLLTPTSKI